MRANTINPCSNFAVQIVKPDFVPHIYDHRVPTTGGWRIYLHAIFSQFADGNQLVSERRLFPLILLSVQ